MQIAGNPVVAISRNAAPTVKINLSRMERSDNHPPEILKDQI
jgi:hypothetical protein